MEKVLRIYLIGYMGAGKTTLGKALAAEMGLDFIDLDRFIEARRSQSVSQIFAAVGEAGFRRIERAALLEVAAYENVVIALGGGTPCFFDNMAVVRASGVSLYLKPSDAVLLRRLTAARASRPVIAAKSDAELATFIAENLAAREPYYLQADLVIPSDRLESRAEIRATARAVAQQVTEYYQR